MRRVTRLTIERLGRRAPALKLRLSQAPEWHRIAAALRQGIVRLEHPADPPFGEQSVVRHGGLDRGVASPLAKFAEWHPPFEEMR